MRAIRIYARPFAAIVGLMLIALVVAVTIIHSQGARFPWVQAGPVRMTAVLSSAQGITPGQGQTVQVAGVPVGKIKGVTLQDGSAVLQLDIQRKYVDTGLIRTNAHALLRPRTPLRDMYLQLSPGSWKRPAAGKGFRIPLANTLPDVSIDEILQQLDARTRDYLQLLITGTGQGLRGRGDDLAEVFRRFGPTARDLGRVTRSVSAERTALRQAVSAFTRVSRSLAARPQQLATLVSAGNATFSAFASEDRSLRATVAQLPGTLRRATLTLQQVQPLAAALGPTATGLLPTLPALQRANRALLPLGREATPTVRTRIRPFVRAARPVVRDLAPAARSLAPSAGELRRAGAVLNHLFNMLGFNRDGRQGPDTSGRDEGYLFWLAWATHQGDNLINVDDANGPMRPVFLSGTCATLTSLVNFQPALEFGMALSPLLATLCGNPSTRSIKAPQAAKGAR